MDTIKTIRPICAERNNFNTSAHICLENFKTTGKGVLGQYS
jgi:hypothetical protein